MSPRCTHFFLFYPALLFFCHAMHAEIPVRSVPKTLDSLQVYLTSQPIDSLYTLAMKDCAFQYIIHGKYSKADSLRAKLEELNVRLREVVIEYYVFFINATLAYHQSDNRGCLNNFIGALRLIEANPKLFKPERIEGAINNVAIGYSRIDKPDSVMHFALKAIHFQEKNGFKNSSPYISIGNVLKNYHKYDQALPYFQKALAIKESEKDMRGTAVVESRIGALYDNLHKPGEAITYYKKALMHARQANYPLLQTDVLVNLGILCVQGKKYDDAKAYFNNGEKICRELGNQSALATNYHNQGEMYRELKNFALAESYYTRSLEIAKESGDHSDLYSANQAMAELYMDTGDYKKACDFLQRASVAKDSIFEAETSQKVQELLLSYESEKKQQQITFLNQQNMVQSLQLSVRRRNEVLLLSGIGVLVILAVVGYRRYRLKSQLEMEKVRSSIAADFHDELGANLSSIALYSDLLLRNQATDTVRSAPLLSNINQNARQTLSAINDLIWSIKPDNDVLEGTVLRMKEFSIPLMEARNIHFEFHVEEVLRKTRLDMAVRKSVYLIFKEAVNNAVKYSGASTINVMLRETDHTIHLEVADNGKGFQVDSVREGNGLGNMRKRAQEINGVIEVRTQPGSGCIIHLYFKRKG